MSYADLVRALRDMPKKLRATSQPLSTVIPLLQRAADAIESLQSPAAGVSNEPDDRATIQLAADAVVIANATGNPDLYREAVAALIRDVRALPQSTSAEQGDQYPVLVEMIEGSAAQWDRLYEHCGIGIGEFEGAGPIIEYIATLRAAMEAK